jgi:hypothetical protein
MNHNKEDTYDVRDEKGIKITDPNKAKAHIANYFEELYQAREGDMSHNKWTDHHQQNGKQHSKNTPQQK